MPCKKCSCILIMDSDYSFKCPKCDNFGFLYSKEDTINFIKAQFKNKCKEFLDLISEYELEEILYSLNYQRNILNETTFFNDYFSLTFGIGLILRNYNKIKKISKQRITPSILEEIIQRSHTLYLNIHHLYFTKFDAIRKIDLIENNNTMIKYTENWTPIFKRCLLSGSLPIEPAFNTKFGMYLFASIWYRKVFLENMHDKYKHFSKITNNLDFLHNYLFHYPWGDYLKISRDQFQIDYFLKLIKEINKHNIYNKNDRILIKKEYRTYIINKWLSKINDSFTFPIIFEINDLWCIPTTFFNKMIDIYDLFSTGNRKKYGEYQENIGKALEDRVFHDLNCFNLNCNSPIDNKRLLRFKESQISNEELMDVGAIDHQNKLLYVIECKNKSRIKLHDYNPLKLYEYIKREFNEFKDRDLPRIEQLKVIWKLKNYKTISLFFNLVPLFGEFKYIELEHIELKLIKLEGIYIIQNFAEIGAIILHNFRKNNATFYEIYKIPIKFRKIITNEFNITINYRIPQDIGYLLGENIEQYIIELGDVLDISISKGIGDIDIKLKEQDNIINIEIPPELLKIFENKEININDEVSVLFYRISPYSQMLILGRIWKL